MEKRDELKTDILSKLYEVQKKIKENKAADIKKEYANIEEEIESFKQLHLDYHALLTDEDQQLNSSAYYKEADTLIKKLKAEIELHMKTDEDEVKSTTSSRASSRASAKRTDAKARKAALLAEARQFQNLKAIEEEEMRLKWRKEEIKRQTEIEKAQAEEDVYAECEEEERMSVSYDRSDQHGKDVTMQEAMQETKSSEQSVIKEACQSDETQISATQLLMHQRVIDLMQAPAADICTFDGDPLKYYTFIHVVCASKVASQNHRAAILLDK